MNDLELDARAVAAPARAGSGRRASLVATALSVALFLAGMIATTRGRIAQPAGGALVTAAYVAALASGLIAARHLGLGDPARARRSIFARHGFWLTVIAGALYLPTLGASSLWDPWETHYAEVAREILARRDWISLWWAHDGFFYSKPVLVFWMQAASMAVLGVDPSPDRMLAGGAHPEWAIRLPNALLAIGALYVLYAGVARVSGRRAALLGALVLATCPFWSMLAHQSTTDMPFVAAMSAAMGLLLVGLGTPDDAEVRSYTLRVLGGARRVSLWHVCMGAIVLLALPQALYLLSRNVDLILTGPGPHGFRPHLDEFRAGSPGNCGLPGNAVCAPVTPAHAFEPCLQALVWLACLAALVVSKWKERRARRIAYLAAWLFAAVATLAKGPAGVGLPVICALAYLGATRRWSELTRLELASGALIVSAVALPWYVAAFVRHGAAFSDELIFKDMINRAFSHVHDTNEGEDTGIRYYLAQLGFGLFPWTGLAPLGLVAWMRRREDAATRAAGSDTRARDASVLLFMWFLFAFALFAFMGTKFHHYVFPAVPPAAMLIGIALDDAWRARYMHHTRMLGAAALAGALLLTALTHDLAGEAAGAIRFAQLFSYQYRRLWPDMLDYRTVLAVAGASASLLLALFAVPRLRRHVTVVLVAGAIAFTAWGLDAYLIRTAPHWGQGDVIRAYYQDRHGEEEPLVAYQMNWKGENFYTGNRVPAFIQSGAAFTSWIAERRRVGTKVVYFVSERARVRSLEAEAGARAYREVTGREASHQFTLVRAEL
jgi:4-amino-4-deoxy-L-arabinose transferase-like glycosyltransferase